MPDDKPLNPDVVRSIFNKRAKQKKLSSLFGVRKGMPARKKQPARAEKRESPCRQWPIGIDIGTSAVKIAQVCLRDNKPYLCAIGIKEFPPEAMHDAVLRGRLLPDLLREMVNEYGLKGDAHSTLSTNIAHIRNATFPKMPRDEVDGAVKWEIQQAGSPRMEELSYDYIILNEEKMSQAERIEALIISTPRQEILKHIALLESVGLHVLSVEVDPLSLVARLEHRESIKANEVVVLLDCGGDATRLIIIVNKELRFMRALSSSGFLFTKTIQEYCNVSLQEAEALKKRYGLCALSVETAETTCPAQDEDRAAQVKNAIYLSIEKLIVDIEHTFKYFSYQLMRSEVTTYDKVIVSGGTAQLKKLVDFLRNRLRVPVEIDNPFEGLTVARESAHALEAIGETPARFGVAVGVALRAIER